MRGTLGSKLSLVALCAWCMTLLAVRRWYAHSPLYSFLDWNLFLAVIPAVAAAALRALGSRRRLPVVPALLLGAVWLTFLPNAPYLVTDLVHLRPQPPVPLWFDVVLFGSYAATGVMLGYSSVADVEDVARVRLGRVAGAALALGAFAACGAGIYLGRFLRWNTWDLLDDPVPLFGQIAERFSDPLAHPQAWGVGLIYGAALALGYFALKALSPAFAEQASGMPAEGRRAPRRGRAIASR